MQVHGRSLYKILISIAVLLIVLVIAGYFAVRSFLTPTRIRAIAENVAREILQRPVAIGDVCLHFGLNIGITVGDISVDNIEGFTPGPMMIIGKTVMNLRLLPLLGKRIVINSLELEGLQVNLERNKNNELNYSFFIPAGAQGTGWSFALNEIKLREGSLRYRDAITDRLYDLQDIEQRVRFQRDRISTTGKLLIQIPKGKDLPELKIIVSDAIEYDTVTKTIAISRASITANSIQLKLSGTVGKSMALDLDGTLTIDDLSESMNLLPSATRPSELRGAIKADFKVEGDTKKPTISGHCKISNVKVLAKGMERAFEKIDGKLSFNRSAIEDIGIQGNIGKAKFNVKGGVSDLTTKDPQLDMTVTLDGDLADVQALTKELKDIKMNGPLTIKAALEGSIKKPRYTADIKINGAYVEGIGLAQPISKMYLSGRLQDNKLRIDDCKFGIGRSDFNLKGQVSDFKNPVIQIENRSNFVDLDELIPVPEKAKGEPQKGKPLPLTVQGSLNIKRLTGVSMEFKNIKTNIKYETGIIDVRNCAAETFDGQIYFDFYCDANQPEPYRISTHMQSIATEKILQRFLHFNRLTGEMSGTADFQGQGLDKASVKSNLNATSDLQLRSGEFKNFPFITKLLDWLGLKNYSNVTYDNLQCSFQISNGKTMVKDWTLSSRTGNYLANGTIGLNGDLDLHVAVTLPKHQSDIVKNYHGDWVFYVDEAGNAVIDMLVSGKFESPAFKLDANKMGERLSGKLKDEFKKKREDFEQKLKDLLKRKW